MHAIHKEKIYIELRKYHLQQFPRHMSSQMMSQRLLEFRVLEDSIINMLLGLVNGKRPFDGFSREINLFKKQIAISPVTSRDEDLDRKTFTVKLQALAEILQIANGLGFPLKTRKGLA